MGRKEGLNHKETQFLKRHGLPPSAIRKVRSDKGLKRGAQENPEFNK